MVSECSAVAKRTLVPALSFDDMLGNPIGRYACQGTILYWCVDPTLNGISAWGRPSAADIATAIAMFDRCDLRHYAEKCDFILDLRRLEAVEVDGFAVLERAFADRVRVVEQRTHRHALLRSGGLVGALGEGFLGLVGAELSWASFADCASGLAWLGRPELAPTIDALADLVVERGSVAIHLRAWFFGHQFDGRLNRAAQGLVMSTRTLQRELGLRGTSFRTERDAARLARADDLLRDSEYKLEVIANELGFRSAANFSTWFKARRCMSPRAFRIANR